MSFKGVVCWREDMVAKAMDTEALQTSRAIFLATHHPIRMYRASNVQGGRSEPDDEHRFLKDFLRPEGWAFAAVLGESGTGKSHLIRWLDLNVPRHDRRKVLLIPKVGTNLRNIIGQILDGMEGPRFDEYRNRLRSGSQDRSEAESRMRLLANLAIAVGESQERSRRLTETEAYLARHLPDFLLDGVFRAHLLADGGRIHQLVTHAIGRGEVVERIDRPREFVLKDLPLEGLPDLASAGAAARTLHGLLLTDADIAVAAVAWINEHLGVALRELLNMGGENLQELMLDVREELGSQSIELVILIEDFAKLQGIDRQLLEALLTREHQPGRRPLCALRTALAVTTGYFERLEDTVKTRISFRVVMDVTSIENGGLVTDADVEEFTSRYLNAIRQSESALDDWASAPDSEREMTPPNACEECRHRTICHESFGARDGVGLYPFNRHAVSRAVRRLSSQGRFNPRTLINRVMRETFEKYTGDIRSGEFPSPSLQQQFGASALTALVSGEVRQKDPVHWRRRMVLLDLWTDGLQVVNLPAGVHEAFSLPLLEQVNQLRDVIEGVSPRVPTPPAQPAPTSEVPELPEGLTAALRDLDEWQNGNAEDLTQSAANKVRALVFRAVVEHIDWDAELMLRGSFAGAAGMMLQQRYIDFSRSGEKPRTGIFRLNIPVNAADLTDAALALQGLLLYEHFGHWNFANGPEHWRAYAGQLELWSARVLLETQRPTVSGRNWDPVPALIELLAVGARVHGMPAGTNPGTADFIAALFGEWGKAEDDDTRTAEWRELAKVLSKNREKMVDQLLARVACTKGGSQRVQIIDASRFREPLKSIRGSWVPKEQIPADAINEYRSVADLQERVKSLLADAVRREKERLLHWADRVSDDLMAGDQAEVLRALHELQNAARGAALSPPVRQLAEAIAAFPSAAARKTLRECLGRLRGATTLAQDIAEVSRTSDRTMQSLEAVANAADRYMTDTEARIQDKHLELQRAGGGALDAARTELQAVIERLEELLDNQDPGK